MIDTEKKQKFGAVDLAKCAIFVVLMTLSAYITIPFSPMPLTFQTIICTLSALLLGAKYAALSMTCYLILGIIGVPVFSKGGGFWYISEPSFGYIIGYVAAAIVAGAFAHKRRELGFKRAFLAAIFAVAIDYGVGIIYFSVVWKFILKSSGLLAAVLTYNLTFLIKDITLCVLAALLSVRLLPIINGKFKK